VLTSFNTSGVLVFEDKIFKYFVWVFILTLVVCNVFSSWFVIVDVVKANNGLKRFDFLPITKILGIVSW